MVLASADSPAVQTGPLSLSSLLDSVMSLPLPPEPLTVEVSDLFAMTPAPGAADAEAAAAAAAKEGRLPHLAASASEAATPESAAAEAATIEAEAPRTPLEVTSLPDAGTSLLAGPIVAAEAAAAEEAAGTEAAEAAGPGRQAEAAGPGRQAELGT